VLDRVRPVAVILMELEVWPNLISICARRGIPVGIANGRVTEEKSMRRFRKPVIRSLARSMFRQIAWVGAQDEAYAARFVELGVPADRVRVTGSMKYDTAAVADRVDGDEQLAKEIGIDRSQPLIVAGSTGPGEEEMLLDSWREIRSTSANAALQLAIVPRKPERFEEVARLIESRGHLCIRRSRGGPGGENAVFLGDTMGELRKFYSLASVVFVGRTLIPMGGSDLMEVAALGKPMVYGPHVENFAEASEKLLQANAAVQVKSAVDLKAALERLLSNRSEADEMGRRAQDVVQANVGATGRTVELLLSKLGRPRAAINP